MDHRRALKLRRKGKIVSNFSAQKSTSTRGSSHLNEDQVANWLNLSKRTLQGWRVKGEGPPFEKFGRSVRYAVATVEEWIAERERSSTTASSPPALCNIHETDFLSDHRGGGRS